MRVCRRGGGASRVGRVENRPARGRLGGGKERIRSEERPAACNLI